jgi:hypothetical protein
MNEAMQQVNVNGMAPRTRRGKKRLVFQPPRNSPSSVRGLWERASPEERARAHTTCVSILSMWLGRKSRQAVASELSLPPLRVWQLSQAAVSGMLAGLLKQPRGHKKGLNMEPSEEDPRVLKAKIAELEEENESLRQLVEVLKSLPAAREQLARRSQPKPEVKPRVKSKGKTEVQRGPEGRGGTPAGGAGETAPR